jgi:hypothetical protein
MVRLFYGLCARSGIIEAAPAIENSGKAADRKLPTRARSSQKPKTTQTEDGSPQRQPPPPPPPPPMVPTLHPAILTLTESLPEFEEAGVKPEFSEADREAWFAYAKATFNLIYALPAGDKA